jgi:hypothetical protein
MTELLMLHQVLFCCLLTEKMIVLNIKPNRMFTYKLKAILTTEDVKLVE